MNLLIVNDEKRTADVMVRGIEWGKSGISEVFAAYDADSARSVLEENVIDIILCDIEMPGENGISLITWVRGQMYDAECIFLTCHADFDYAKEAILLGCIDYILMPAKPEKICDAVFKAVQRIGSRRLNDELAEYGKAYVQDKAHQDSETTKRSVAEIVSDIKTYILNSISDHSLSVSCTAEHFHFHPVYLNRLFKQNQGTSVSQFIINERMKLAGKLLTDGTCKGAEVAALTGYTYYSNFHNMFRKFYGCTPNEYQERFGQTGADGCESKDR